MASIEAVAAALPADGTSTDDLVARLESDD
jgi:hypothetical protein